jgi:hypothetical protein
MDGDYQQGRQAMGCVQLQGKRRPFRFDVKVERMLDLEESMKFVVLEDGTVEFSWEYRTFSFKISK